MARRTHHPAQGRPALPGHCNVTPIRVRPEKSSVGDLRYRPVGAQGQRGRLESLANIDQLTRLPNRPGFAKLLGDWLAAGKGTCAVIFVDVDQLARGQ